MTEESAYPYPNNNYSEPLAPDQIVFVAPPAFPLNPDG